MSLALRKLGERMTIIQSQCRKVDYVIVSYRFPSQMIFIKFLETF